MALLHTLPADDGFRMPAEFDEQQAVVMIWPFRQGSWGADPAKAIEAFRSVAFAINRFAKVLMLAPAAYIQQARNALPMRSAYWKSKQTTRGHATSRRPLFGTAQAVFAA